MCLHALITFFQFTTEWRARPAKEEYLTEWAVLGWPFIFSNEVTNRLREIGHLDNDR